MLLVKSNVSNIIWKDGMITCQHYTLSQHTTHGKAHCLSLRKQYKHHYEEPHTITWLIFLAVSTRHWSDTEQHLITIYDSVNQCGHIQPELNAMIYGFINYWSISSILLTCRLRIFNELSIIVTLWIHNIQCLPISFPCRALVALSIVSL